MSEWRGLHDPTQPCPDCGICRDGRWCRCCLEAQVQRVRELHWPNSYSFVDRGYSCGHCGHPYPCDTIRALDGDGDA